MTPTLHGRSLIAGQFGGPGGAPFRALAAESGKPLAPEFREAVPEELDEAMQAALAAAPEFAAETPERRAALLEGIAAEIESLGPALLDRAGAESGLPQRRLEGERARTCAQLRLFAALVREGSWVDARIDRADPARAPLPRPDVRRVLVPIGPVVVFGASNFPLAFSVAGGDTASALAAGCPVVVKAHPAHPGTGEMVAGAVVRALAANAIPPGVFSFLHGGAGTGLALVRHPATAAVGFTGSHAAGRALFDAAAARPDPIPVFAEMSSVNPVFILPGALRERGADIARRLLESFSLGVGQFCTKPGLVFLTKGPDADAFVNTLAALVGPAPSPGPMLTAGIRAAFVRARSAASGRDGVRIFGPEPEAAGGPVKPSFAVAAAARFRSDPALANEVFGPFTLLLLADSAEELAACAGSLAGQLTATVHATDAEWPGAAALVAILARKAGRLIANGFPTGVEVGHAMHHGGPYPATTDVRFTSVGTAAIHRFARPLCFQDFPDGLLPPPLRRANPLGVVRRVDGLPTRDPEPAAKA